MVSFQSLELVGFKSFSDKIRLAFNDRVTCVVGPNGCGKSNLFDAIGWVLGAQNARNLRGEKMEDVIFNGTGKRKPSGMTRVALTLRKTDDRPIVVQGREYTGETLEICRKLYRSGESIYSVNQRRCRLKDIHQVMEDLGLGFASYAFIAQGRIESFLTGKPLDRRALIEEAAGITGYRSRRRSAELKLEMAQQNLLRVNDIVSEVERRVRSLKRQASKARRYQEFKRELRRILAQKFVLEATDLTRRLERLQQELDALNEALESLAERLAAGEKAYRESVGQRDSLEEALSDLRQRHSQTLLEIDRTENSIQYHQEQIESTRRFLSSNQAEEKILLESLEKVSNELIRFSSERERLDQRAAEIDQSLEQQTTQLEKYGNETEQAEAAIEELRGQLLRLSAEIASLTNSEAELKSRLRESAADRERLEKEYSDSALKLRECASEIKDKQDEIERKRARLSDLQQSLEDTRCEKTRLEEELFQLGSEEAEVNNKLIACRERLQSLHEVELNHSQYSEGVRNFLNHLSRKDNVRASGTLADQIETSPEYEKLVEEFLDKELEYVLVDSMDQAVAGLSEIRALKSGKCTFLSLNSSNGFGKDGGSGVPDLPVGADQGVFGTLGGLLRMEPEVEQAFRRVLPQRADAIVVADLDHAFRLAHSYPENTFLTLEGETLTPRGLLSSTTEQPKKLGLLRLKREKKLLEKKAGQVRKLMAGIEKRKGHLQQQLETQLQAWESTRDSAYELEKEILGLQHQEKEIEAEREHQLQALRVLDAEREEASRLEVRLKERQRSISRELDFKRTGREETERRLAGAGESLSQLRTEMKRLQEQVHLVNSDRKVLAERRAALDRTLERIGEQRSGLESRRQASLEARRKSEIDSQEMTAALEELSERLRGLQAEKKQVESLLQDRQREFTAWKQNHPRTEERLARVRDEKAGQQEVKARLEVDRARLETQLQNVLQQCLEQLQTPLAEVAEKTDLDGVEPAEIGRIYNDLRRRLEAFGPVNMTALDEYREHEERYGFLTTQRQDIEQSITDTMRAIQDLNRRSRERFREAFEAVNGHFKDVFQKLFGGGDCGMRLLDEEDLLESGLDIDAQPPGKKLQNVMLLSGGEKALTVLALLVGLFSYRPSRFCVLDEVDAPLDDANVARFNTLVREMSRETQLIVITHNKQTMENADVLFGVTMSEPGISQVVSVQF